MNHRSLYCYRDVETRGKWGRTMTNMFDLGVFVLVVALGLFGFRDGLVRGAVKLVGFIVILILLAVCSDEITALAVTVDVLPEQLSVPLAFVLLFSLAVIGVHFAALLLSGVIALTPVHGLDAGLGCLFGILKALFLGGLVAFAFSYGSPDSVIGRQYRTSRFALPLHRLAVTAFPLLRSAAVSIYRQLDDSLPDIERELMDEQNHADPADFI